jgi:serine/threonine protein kinase
VKLIDFGLTTFPEEATSYVQTRYQRAPEVLLSLTPYSTKADIFSFGVLLYWMYAGVYPVEGDSSKAQLSGLIQLLGDPPESYAKNPRCAGFMHYFYRLKKTTGTIHRREKRFRELERAVTVSHPRGMLKAWDRLGKGEREVNDLYFIIMSTMAYEPEKRPSAESLLKRSFFK